MLPNFLIIGAAKAGTTSLHHYLRAHPQVFMSDLKEPKFFSVEFNWSRGIDWYERHFDPAGDAIAIGEASTIYTAYPHVRGVPERICDVLPGVRMIYLVRHPVERMISHYLMQARLGLEKELSAENALLRDARYLDESRYAMQIEQYLLRFRRERLLVVKSEDLREARGPTMRRVFHFLGVDETWMPPNLDTEYNRKSPNETHALRPTARTIARRLARVPGYRAFAAATPRGLKGIKRRMATRQFTSTTVISDDTRLELEERLRPDIRRLRLYMGHDFDGWGIG